MNREIEVIGILKKYQYSTEIDIQRSQCLYKLIINFFENVFFRDVWNLGCEINLNQQ